MYSLINRLLLFFKPWSYSVSIRLLIIKFFFIETDYYKYEEVIRNTYLSDKIKKTFLNGGNPFSNRLLLIRYCTKLIRNGSNPVAEFGVYKGETLSLIAKCLPKRKCYGFDSFEGLPEAWGNLLPKGFFKTEVPTFKQRNIKLVKGLYQESLNQFLIENDPITFDLIHIDCDLYESTKYVLQAINKNLNSKKFIIIFDEFYGYKDFEKFEFKAFKEFVSNNQSYNYSCIGYSSSSAAFQFCKKNKI